MVAHRVSRERVVQPEPVAPRFITADHGRGLIQMEAILGAGEFIVRARQGAGRNGPEARRLAGSCGGSEFPGTPAKFERHV